MRRSDRQVAASQGHQRSSVFLRGRSWRWELLYLLCAGSFLGAWGESLASETSAPPVSPWPVDVDGDGLSTLGDRIAFQVWVDGGGDEKTALEAAVPRAGPEGAVLDVSATFAGGRKDAGGAEEAAESSGIATLGSVDTKLTLLDAGPVADYPAIVKVRLWKGTAEPPGDELEWTFPWYDDSGWIAVDRTPIGYGYRPPLFLLDDMRNLYSSFYVRITFRLRGDERFAEKEQFLSSLDFDLGVDDGFVAYVDGEEIRRMHIPEEYGWFGSGTAVPHDATAAWANPATSRASGYTDLLSPVEFEPAVDPDGESVLCVQVLNQKKDDVDCLLSPRIHARKRGPFLARSQVDTSQSPDDYMPSAYEIVIRAAAGLGDSIRVEYFLEGDPGTTRTSDEVTIDYDPDGPFGDECTYRIHIPGKDGGIENPRLPISTDVTYRVFVGDERFEDDDLTFRTPGQFGDFSFIAFGNSGLPTTEQASLASVIDAQAVKFCVTAGDMVIRNNRYFGAEEIQELVEPWYNEQAVDHRFYNAYAATMARVPFYATSGEEDLETLTWVWLPPPWLSYLVGDYDQAYCMPETASAEGGDGWSEKFYSFDYGSAHFTVLRTQLFNQPIGRSPGRLSDDQIAFLLDDLSSTKKFWKIVVLYNPPYTSSERDEDRNQIPDDLEFRRRLEQDFGGFEELGVDLVLSGHHPFFEETKAVVADLNGIPTVIQGGPHFVFDAGHPSAPVYVVTGGGGETLWEAVPPLASFSRVLWEQFHVTKITVSDNVLEIQPLNTAGNPIDIDPGPGTSSTITKNIFPPFLRGDSDQNGAIDITDGVFIQNYLFLGGPAPHCLDAVDPDDNGQVNLTDAVYIYNFLFSGGPEPEPPYPNCGEDPTADGLTCLEYYAECP